MTVGRGSVRGRRRADRPAIQMDVAVSIGLTIETGPQALGPAAMALSELGAGRMVEDLRRAITWEGPQEEEAPIVPSKAVEDLPENPQHQVNRNLTVSGAGNREKLYLGEISFQPRKIHRKK